MAGHGSRRVGCPIGHHGPVKITVVGGSRGTGALVAQQAAAAGHEVRTVSRAPGPAIHGVEQLALDATDADALRSAVRGADAVVVTVGAPARKGETPRADVTRAVVAAMTGEGVRRVVAQSSYGVGDSYSSMPFVLRHIAVPLILKQALADHEQQEGVLAASGLDWTVIRPGGLTNEKPLAAVRLAPGDGSQGSLGRVSRADVAAALLAALTDPATIGHTFTLVAG
jgi:uncharacterized protein YbjT (DUF2867 family)